MYEGKYHPAAFAGDKKFRMTIRTVLLYKNEI